MKKNRYHQLFALSKKSALLHSIQNLLDWDSETYLPKKAIHIRSEQLELLASLIHKEQTSSKYKKALQSLIDIETGHIQDPSLSKAEQAALREWRRDYLKTVKLPISFVKQFTNLTSQSILSWTEAKKNNDFKAFAPYLKKIVALLRKKCDYLGYQEHPYDALLDIYEPGMTTTFLISLFGRLKNQLSELIKSIAILPAPREDFLYGSFAKDKQIAFAHDLLEAMGFHKKEARLDLSNHPFCIGLHPFDTRMTTHIHPDYLLSNLFAVIHEGGHGLYNKGRPAEFFGSPLCESLSLGIEESQSRFWETIIGHSHPFWYHFYPKLQTIFPEKLGDISLNEFYLAINHVKPSFIRIEADEVTYSMHIILRFELEKALIEGSLKVEEIPEAWNEKMRDYLGISPQDNTLGCLQDIHWAMGGIGYFPTYTLGNLYAAQIFHTFEKEFPDWQTKVKEGSLSFIQIWLHHHIHQHGRHYTPQELIMRITGSELNEKHFLHYLENKYKNIYHINH